jgi:hypothetical protein
MDGRATPALPARRSDMPNAFSFIFIQFPCVLVEYSSFNLNVGPLNKSMAVIQLAMDYAMVRRCLSDVVYST